MYQPSTNFIGKDGMEWWIGQVTDPKKGKWEDALEKKQADDGEEIYSHRCRCLLYTSPSPRDMRRSRMPSSA